MFGKRSLVFEVLTLWWSELNSPVLRYCCDDCSYRTIVKAHLTDYVRLMHFKRGNGMIVCGGSLKWGPMWPQCDCCKVCAFLGTFGGGSNFHWCLYLMKTGFMMRVKGRLRKDGDFMTPMWTQKLCAVLAFKASCCASKLSRWVFCICVFTLFSWRKRKF